MLKEIGGNKTRMFSWIIRAEQPLRLTIDLKTPMSWSSAETIEIGGVK